MRARILVIDDETHILNYVHETLLCEDYIVKAFSDSNEAINSLESFNPDLVISDVRMQGLTGDDVLRIVKERHPKMGVILITGITDLDHAINAFRRGAFDYITKPFRNTELLDRVRGFFESKETIEDHQGFKPKIFSKARHKHASSRTKFVGSNEKVRQLMSILPQIAPTNAPVFIQAESGSGKEVFSKLLHEQSNRSDKPFVTINCANLPSELVESTLFGHVKGAFTGATQDQEGSFSKADGGTLLLDEITETDLNIQAKLLRVLQEKEFKRVGSQKTEKVDVRIIATTNRNVKQAIVEGKFRQDLFFRLNVIPIHIPSLRDRRDDIKELANFFCEKYSEEYDIPKKSVSDELMQILVQMPWEGNVRELENYIHRGVIMAYDDTELQVHHVENTLFSEAESEFKDEIIKDVPLMPMHEAELYMIKKALDYTNGHQKEAAKLLQISDRTIRNKLSQQNKTN